MSWKCQNCNTLIEDQEFEVCWNCNAEKGSEKLSQQTSAPFCLRCDKELAFMVLRTSMRELAGEH